MQHKYNTYFQALIPKMSFIDEETFTISNGSEKNWVNLTKAELMEIPWMKEAIEGKDSKLFINDFLGFDIKYVTDAGAIHTSDNKHLRISRNTTRPTRLELSEFYKGQEGLWAQDPNYPQPIRCATVSANFGTLPDGFRVFGDGPKKYYYLKNGELSKYPLCICYESYDDGRCFCYDSDLD